MTPIIILFPMDLHLPLAVCLSSIGSGWHAKHQVRSSVSDDDDYYEEGNKRRHRTISSQESRRDVLESVSQKEQLGDCP